VWHHHHKSDNELLREILYLLEKIYNSLKPHSTTAVLSITGDNMATLATLTFIDSASGSQEPPPNGDGSGLVVTFSSDNPNVTLGSSTANGDTVTAPITGTEAFNLSAVVANSSGVDLLDNNGDPFVQPAPLAVPAPPAPVADTAVLSVS
jgi:hypothetical protein